MEGDDVGNPHLIQLEQVGAQVSLLIGTAGTCVGMEVDGLPYLVEPRQIRGVDHLVVG